MYARQPDGIVLPHHPSMLNRLIIEFQGRIRTAVDLGCSLYDDVSKGTFSFLAYVAACFILTVYRIIKRIEETSLV